MSASHTFTLFTKADVSAGASLSSYVLTVCAYSTSGSQCLSCSGWTLSARFQERLPFLWQDFAGGQQPFCRVTLVGYSRIAAHEGSRRCQVTQCPLYHLFPWTRWLLAEPQPPSHAPRGSMCTATLGQPTALRCTVQGQAVGGDKMRVEAETKPSGPGALAWGLSL